MAASRLHVAQTSIHAAMAAMEMTDMALIATSFGRAAAVNGCRMIEAGASASPAFVRALECHETP